MLDLSDVSSLIFFMESVVECLGLKRAGSSLASVLPAGWLSLCAASCFNVFV